MGYGYIDRYSNIKSPVHALDPRVKIILFMLLVVFIVTTGDGDFAACLFYFIIIFTAALLSRVPLRYIFKRSLAVLPFVLLVAVFSLLNGKHEFLLNMLIRAWLAILALVLLSSTTKFPLILKALATLKVPGILVLLLSFMYRYIFVLLEEAVRAETAHRARYFGGRVLRQFRGFGHIIGHLFIRTYERGERIYQSMLSRGFDGSARVISKLKLKTADYLFSAIFLAAVIAVKIKDHL